jgi:cytidine deaminase
MSKATEIDWNMLRQQANDMASRAHAPYSRLTVGAAGITQTGQIAVGCNVENASYGLTLCAECGLVSDLHRLSAGRLLAISVTDGERLLMPCGRCRQLLYEAGGPELMVDADPAPIPLDRLLPDAFGPTDLREGT